MSGDYERRQGITNMPISTLPYHKSPRPLHVRLGLLRWFIELLIRILGKCHKWRDGVLSDNQKKGYEKAEQKVKDAIFADTGIRVRQPSSRGGTTETGGTALRIFSKELIPTFERLLESHRVANAGNFMRIHKNLSIILRVIMLTDVVDTEKLEEICTSTYVEILETWKWVNISESAHDLLGHCFKLMDANGGKGLGNWSEQGAEGKWVRILLKC